MVKSNMPEPTERELSILRIIWDKGACTVRQVNEEMNKLERVGYTTTLKLMQIMADKGLLIRDESSRTHIYEPAITMERTQKQLVGSLLDRAFAGSAEKLVMQALSAKKVPKEELAKIKRMLEEME